MFHLIFRALPTAIQTTIMGCSASTEQLQEMQDRKDIQTARGIAARKYIAAHQEGSNVQYGNKQYSSNDEHMLFGVQGERGVHSAVDDGGDGGGHGMGGDGGAGGDSGGAGGGGDSGGGGGLKM
jgi:uncharacterized membrane protein YgcG